MSKFLSSTPVALLFALLLSVSLSSLAGDYASAYQQCMDSFQAQPAETRFCAAETCAYRACIAAQRLGLVNGDIVIEGGHLTTVPAECAPHVDAMQRCIVEYLNQAIASRRPRGVTGRWQISQSNGFSGTLDLQQESNGHFTGSAAFNGGLSGTVSGTVTGSTVDFTIAYPGGVRGHYRGTLSEDGSSMASGGTQSTAGDSASWRATR